VTRVEATNIERLLGRIETLLEMQGAAIERLNEKADMADEWRHEVRERLEKNEAHGANMARVAEAFDELQKSIREGGIKAKSFLSGAVWGVALAAGAAGATVATFIKWAWAALTGAGA
jgi:hypothetical protein